MKNVDKNNYILDKIKVEIVSRPQNMIDLYKHTCCL